MSDIETELAHQAEVAEIRKALERAHGQLRQAKSKQANLYEAVHNAARDAMVAFGPLKPVPPPPKDARKTGEQVAVLHLTDWQGSKVTSSYNSQIMVKRVHQCLDKALKIVDEHRTTRPIKRMAILFGGDMVEGLWNYPAQLWEIDASLFEQWVSVSRLSADIVRRSLEHFEKVQVVAEWGNHGRIGSKRDHVPRGDNIDRMVYEHARQLLRDESRLSWEDCPEDIQRVEIGRYRALLIHGDEVGRTGFASSTGLLRWANNQRSGAYGWEFRDIYAGHFHHHAEWSLANGEGTFFQTGSTESDNRYANVGMGVSAIPSQRLHFVDPVAGRVTAQYRLELS